MKIHFNDLGAQWKSIKDQAYPRLDDFFNNGNYIHGKELSIFEDNFAQYTGSSFAIGVSNGTDALKLCIQALNFENDKTDIIIPANAYIADIIAIKHQIYNINYNITLIDCDNFYQIDTNLLNEYLHNNRNKYDKCIIMPVHLYGHPSDMDTIKQLAQQFDCVIIEDASQAHGAISNNRMVGTHGDMCVYSLYPGKSLGAMGDAGIITTNNITYKNTLQSLRNYGSPKKYHYDTIGWNNRLDTLQAIILDEKLKLLDTWNKIKIDIANTYSLILKDIPEIQVPINAKYCDKHVYHIYCILADDRDELQNYLENNNVPTVIHYPVPIQKTKPFLSYDKLYNNPNTIYKSNRLLSLPIHPYLTINEIYYICDHIKNFFKK